LEVGGLREVMKMPRHRTGEHLARRALGDAGLLELGDDLRVSALADAESARHCPKRGVQRRFRSIADRDARVLERLLAVTAGQARDPIGSFARRDGGAQVAQPDERHRILVPGLDSAWDAARRLLAVA